MATQDWCRAAPSFWPGGANELSRPDRSTVRSHQRVVRGAPSKRSNALPESLSCQRGLWPLYMGAIGVSQHLLTRMPPSRVHGQGTQRSNGLRYRGMSTPQPPAADLLPARCKIVLAFALWQSITASQARIADQLHMKSAANVSQILRRQRNQPLSRYVD
jgi:hypothetical protein